MHGQLQFSLTRVVAGLAMAVFLAVGFALLIHFNGGDVRPIVEPALCLGAGAMLSMLLPSFLNTRLWQRPLSHPLRTYWARLKAVLFTPRRLQFSVRSGPIYLTVFCCWLGYCVDRVHRVRHAAAVIVQAGGRVSYQSREPFVRVRAVGIARQPGRWDNESIRRLLPHIRALQPRRIVVGSLASEVMLDEIEAQFPNVELYFMHPRSSG